MKTILGIDCSSTTIGLGVLHWDEITNDIKFVRTSYIKPIKTGSIIERLVDTRNKIRKVIAEVKPDYIAIEDIISFLAGGSTAQTIIVLTSFNRMVGLVAYDYLGKPPALYNVMTIRHGIKTGKKPPKKEDIPNLVAKHLVIRFPYEYNKKGKKRVENGDMADGIAVALYQAFVLAGKIKRKGKKK